jgi:hypothetical protein
LSGFLGVMTASADIETILGGFDASGSLIPKYQRLFTDKLAFRWLEVRGVWSLDSATPATPGHPAHASGSSLDGTRAIVAIYSTESKLGYTCLQERLMINQAELNKLDDHLADLLRSQSPAQVSYTVFPDFQNRKEVPFATWAELHELIKRRQLEFEVDPTLAYKIGSNVASPSTKSLINLINAALFGSLLLPIVVAVLTKNWLALIGMLGLVGVFFTSPNRSSYVSRVILSLIGLLLVIIFVSGDWLAPLLMMPVPYILQVSVKYVYVAVTKEAVRRSTVLTQSMAEDGHLLLKLPGETDFIIPRMR